MALIAPITVETAFPMAESAEIVYPSFTNQVLEDLDIAGGKDAIAVDPELRHLATKRALILYDQQLMRRLAHDTEKNRRWLQRSEDMLRVCTTTEVQFADPEDELSTSFIDDIVDRSMGYTALKPTLDYITPKAVDVLRDDALAAAYLERMLGDGDLINDWVPVVDWGHLQYVGGVEGVDPNGTNNIDLVAMKSWAERFTGRPIGQVVGIELDAIDEMLKYPTLFRLPGVRID